MSKDTGCSLALAMRYNWRGNSLLVVHSFDSEPHEVELRPGVENGGRLVNLLQEEGSCAGDDGVHRIVLDAFGYHWYRVGGLNYALRREREILHVRQMDAA